MLMRFFISRAKTAEVSASVRLGRLWSAVKGKGSARFSLFAARIVLALSGVSVSSALQLTVTWDTTTGATGYKVERSTDGSTFTQIASVSATSYTDSNLTASTYWYRVRAFNATATSVVYRTFLGRLSAARTLARTKTPTATFPSPLPVLRIDHLFVSPEIQVSDVFAPFTPLTRSASDHLPLVMDFEVAG